MIDIFLTDIATHMSTLRMHDTFILRVTISLLSYRCVIITHVKHSLDKIRPSIAVKRFFPTVRQWFGTAAGVLGPRFHGRQPSSGLCDVTVTNSKTHGKIDMHTNETNVVGERPTNGNRNNRFRTGNSKSLRRTLANAVVIDFIKSFSAKSLLNYILCEFPSNTIHTKLNRDPFDTTFWYSYCEIPLKWIIL